MKHVLITGGSDGLGEVTAQKLVQAGYDVTILGKEETKTRQAAQELGCKYVVADISDYDQVTTAFTKAGQVDILINNAGIWIQGALDTNDPKYMKRVMEVNVLGSMYCTKAVVAQMKERKVGKIINVSSQGGLSAKAERGVYNASKWALTGFTKAMQAELKEFNISVVGLYPGALKDTGIFAKAGNDRDMSNALNPEIVADGIVYVCNLPDGVNVPELGLESLSY